MSRTFVITVYCAERYRTEGSAIVDALAARGYEAEVVTGPNARDALRRAHAVERERLRVLLITADLNGSKLAALYKGLDPSGRGDLFVAKLDTTAWELAQRVAEFERQLRRRRAVRANSDAHTAPRPAAQTRRRPLLDAPPPAVAPTPARAPRAGSPPRPAFAGFEVQRRSSTPVVAAVFVLVGVAGLALWTATSDSGKSQAATQSETGPSSPEQEAVSPAPDLDPASVESEPVPASAPAAAEPSSVQTSAPAPANSSDEPEETLVIEEDPEPVARPGPRRPRRKPDPDRRLHRPSARPHQPSDSDSVPKPDSDSVPESGSDSVPESGSVSDSDSDSVSESVPVPESDSDSVSESESVPDVADLPPIPLEE